uniref:Nitroreductase domain-containing protein n=1 Tax=Heterorhabditis bacteriophora TaxID=37862 RepID=A0A1I7WNN5_HETBA
MHEHLLKEFEIPYSLPNLTDKEGVRNSQFFYEQMKMRRSVRNFSTRPVSLKIIQNLIKTAGCSPSVGNTQPWKFCVIVNEEKKREIREKYNLFRMGAGSEWVVDISQLQVTWSRPYITDAPVVLVICHEIFKEVSGTKQRLFHYNQVSTSISVGMLLAALQLRFIQQQQQKVGGPKQRGQGTVHLGTTQNDIQV